MRLRLLGNITSIMCVLGSWCTVCVGGPAFPFLILSHWWIDADLGLLDTTIIADDDDALTST